MARSTKQTTQVTDDLPLVSPVDEQTQVSSAKKERYLQEVERIEKDFGKGSLVMLGSVHDGPIEKVTARSTGILSIDRATRIGGLPRGRIVEILGPESSGKTSTVLHTIAEELRVNPGAIINYIDLEYALEPSHMENIGVHDIVIGYPDNAEQALEMVKRLAAVSDIVVVDSVSALSPEAEQEEVIGKAQPGRVAFLMSQTLRQLPAIAASSGCTVIFINQLRYKIGVVTGSPETTSGGNALKFYASMRIDMRKISTEKSGSEAYANRIKVKVIKNKCAPPLGEEEFTMFYDARKTTASSALEVAKNLGVVTLSGSWYSYKGNKFAQGFPNAVDYLVEHPELKQQIIEDCYAANLFKKVVRAGTSVI